MICEHSLMYSRGSLGFLDYTEEEKQMFTEAADREHLSLSVWARLAMLHAAKSAHRL